MIAVLDAPTAFVDELRRAAGDVPLRPVESADAILLEGSAVDAVVIGADAADPVRACQSLRPLNVPIIICAAGQNVATVQSRIQFTPLISSDVTVVPASEIPAVAGAMARAAERMRRRRSFATSIRAANLAIAAAIPQQPGVHMYVDRLLDVAPVGIVNTDGRGVVESFNQRAVELLRGRELRPGERLSLMFDANCESQIQTLLTGHAGPEPVRLTRRTTSQVMEARASRFVAASGEQGVLFALQDVTDRVLAERARDQALERERDSRRELDRIAGELFESERSLKLALIAGGMGTWRWNAATNDVIWSESLEALYGLPPSSFGGTYEAFLALVHPDDRERVIQTVAEAGRQGPEYQIAFRIRRADGAERWIADRGMVLYDSRGERTGITGVCWDDTDRKRVEEEVARAFEQERRSRSQAEAAAQQLRQMNGELEQFAYVASHDLQEPLRTIASFAQLLERKYGAQLPAEANDYIARVVQGAKRLQTLIRDLLDYSRVSRDDERQEGAVDMNAVVDSAIESVRSAITESGATVTHDPLPVLPRANESQMLQLIQNLLSNAVKYRRPEAPPEVKIGVRREADAWRFCVSDNGQGFDPAYAERVFGIFKRLHGTDVAGTGIGLALCKRIVERHGGRIWVVPVPGHGSTFYFTIPG